MNIIRISTAVVLIVGAGLVHGAWTNRWRVSTKLASLAAKLESVPMVIGDWKGTRSELPQRERAAAGAVGCLARQYTNPGRGVTVTVLLLCGLPGDISMHTPDVCYPGTGYTLSSPSPFDYRYGPGEQQAGFQTAVATRTGTSPSSLRIFWSWNASRGWNAPDEPRWVYGSEPALCKLYVIRETGGTAVAPKSDPCNDLLAVFLPELDRHVFAGLHERLGNDEQVAGAEGSP